jgi:adenylate cyclase class IV
VISQHDEIEAKLSADNVDMMAFVNVMKSRPDLERYKYVSRSPDDYYENGTAVVRHRGKDGSHELTVKRRKSNSSTRDREEIDLHFSPTTAHESVSAFLRATGYVKAFTLTKEAHIFWVKPTPNITLSFVIYDVWKQAEGGNARRFIEVEAEKGSNVTAETGKRYVREAVRQLQESFKHLGEPLNESLYEIFSGKRYSSV